MCLLEETIRLSLPRLSQIAWQPGTADITHLLSAGPIVVDFFTRFACVQQEQQRLRIGGSQRPDDRYCSSIIRAISMALSLFKAVKTLPSPVRKAIFCHVSERCVAALEVAVLSLCCTHTSLEVAVLSLCCTRTSLEVVKSYLKPLCWQMKWIEGLA